MKQSKSKSHEHPLTRRVSRYCRHHLTPLEIDNLRPVPPESSCEAHRKKDPKLNQSKKTCVQQESLCASPSHCSAKDEYSSSDSVEATLKSPRPKDYTTTELGLISPCVKKNKCDHTRRIFSTICYPRYQWQPGNCLAELKLKGSKLVKGLNLSTGKLMAVRQIEKKYLHLDDIDALRKCADQLMVNGENSFIENILSVQDEGTKLHIFSEYVPCGSIRKLLVQFGPLDIKVVQTFCHQILLALEHLHRRNFYLRHLSTASVLVGQNRSIKVSALSSTISMLKNTSAGSRDLSDIQLLGQIMVEMLTGMAHVSNALPHHVSGNAIDFLRCCENVSSNYRGAATDLLKHPFIAAANTQVSPKTFLM